MIILTSFLLFYFIHPIAFLYKLVYVFFSERGIDIFLEFHVITISLINLFFRVCRSMSSKRKNTPTKLAKEDSNASLERHIFNSNPCFQRPSTNNGHGYNDQPNGQNDNFLYGSHNDNNFLNENGVLSRNDLGIMKESNSYQEQEDNDNNNLGSPRAKIPANEPPFKLRRVSPSLNSQYEYEDGGDGEAEKSVIKDDIDVDNDDEDIDDFRNHNESDSAGGFLSQTNSAAPSNGVGMIAGYPISAKMAASSSSQRKSMESVLRRLNSRAEEAEVDTGKVYNSVHEVLAGESTLTEKEKQITDMIAQLQNIKENLNRQKGEVSTII